MAFLIVFKKHVCFSPREFYVFQWKRRGGCQKFQCEKKKKGKSLIFSSQLKIKLITKIFEI